MLDFHEKRKLKSLLYSKPAAYVLFGIALLFSWSVYERFEREREMALKRYELEDKLVELRMQATSLEGEVARLQSDRGIEEELRDRFEVAKTGEQIIVVVGDERASSATSARPLPEPHGFLGHLRAFFHLGR
jgi:cell division protein FtsB